MRRRSFGTSASGSVSVYFIVLTAAVVLVSALLIDFSRIAAFRSQAEAAVHSGVRSVLSSYDPLVYEKYGLFIRGGEDASAVFRTTLEGHVKLSGNDGEFSYLDSEWTSAILSESRPLGDHRVFRRQVAEEMKYKAPIDLTLEMVSRFRGLSPALKEAASTVGMLEQIRQAYDRREAALDGVLAEQKRQGAEIAVVLEGIAGGSPDKETLSAAAKEISLVIHRSDPAARRSLQQARDANERISALARQAASSSGSGIPSGGGNPQSTAMADIRQTASSMTLPQSFFDSYSSELAVQVQTGISLQVEAERFAALLESEAESAEETDRRPGEAEARLYGMAAQYRFAYGNAGRVLEERRLILQRHRSAEGDRKAQEQTARSEWMKWTGMLQRLKAGQGTQREKEIFLTVDRKAEANLSLNREAASAGDLEGLPGLDAAEAQPEQAMDQTAGALDTLEAALQGTREALFFSEYTMGRFTRFSPANVHALMTGAAIPLQLESQETEYILYGFADPVGNLAAAYSEIFAFRLAVRTLEGLVESRSLGHPLLVLAAALAYGISHALKDMLTLMERDNITLSKYAKVETSYGDYLRLFMLLHGNSPSRWSRVIAVAEYRTGISFAEAYTYVSGEGTASLRLWFFPGLLKLLGRTGQLGGKVTGDRYEASYTADSSYQ